MSGPEHGHLLMVTVKTYLRMICNVKVTKMSDKDSLDSNIATSFLTQYNKARLVSQTTNRQHTLTRPLTDLQPYEIAWQILMSTL